MSVGSVVADIFVVHKKETIQDRIRVCCGIALQLRTQNREAVLVKRFPIPLLRIYVLLVVS